MVEKASQVGGSQSTTRTTGFAPLATMLALFVVFAYLYALVLLVDYGADRFDPGWTYRADDLGWYVETVDGQGPASGVLRAGDRLLEIDGSAVGRGLPWLALKRIVGAEDYQVVVLRDGERIESRLPTRVVRAPEHLLQAGIYYLMGLALLVVALSIGVSRPKPGLARYMFLTWLALAVGLLSQALYPVREFLGDYELRFFFFTQHFLFVAFAMGYSFYSRFPSGVQRPGVWSWLRYVFFGWAGTIVALLAANQLYMLRDDIGAGVLGIDYRTFLIGFAPIYATFIAAVLFAMCAVVWSNYRHAADPDEHRRIRWVVIGSIAGILPYALNSALGAARITSGTVSYSSFSAFHWFSVLAILIIPSAVSFAVVKHRLFDIEFVVRRGLQYLLATNALRALLIVEVLGLVAILTLNASATVEEVFTHNIHYLVLLAVTVISLIVHQPLRTWIDRRFFREAFDREQVLLDLVARLKMLEAEREILPCVDGELGRTMHPKSLYLFLPKRSQSTLASTDMTLDLPANVSGSQIHRLVTSLQSIGHAVDLPVTRRISIPPEIEEWFMSLGVVLLVPMVGGGTLLEGIILLGERKSEQPYSRRDRTLLETIAAEMAFTYEKFRLRELVETEQKGHKEALLRSAELEISERRERDANRAKSIFLANMSHELRTPLNAILGFAQLLERSRGLDQEQQEYLDTITRSGEHLLGLINDVLSISKIEAGKLSLTEDAFDLIGLLTGIEEIFRLRAAQKDLQFSVDIKLGTPQWVVGDEGKIRQVMINILGNAVKFTESGFVWLRVFWDPVGSRAIFEVEDTGPGIPQSEYERIFEPFGQADVGQRSREGTGLGLAISKSFVELMGGVLSVSSLEGEGATFRFDVPLEPTERPEEEAQPDQVVEVGNEQKRRCVLVVDDKTENRRLLVHLLTSAGFDVREAENGDEAVSIWSVWRPELVWMDIRMPVMDGYEATKKIRSRETAEASVLECRDADAVPDAPERTVIIALTANAFDHDKQAIFEAGCDDYVVKPYRTATIFDKMQDYLGVGSSRADRRAGAASSEVAQASASPVGLDGVPEGVRKSLSRTVDAGDLTAARAIIEEIRSIDESLARHLLEMLRGYRLDEIQDFIERA